MSFWNIRVSGLEFSLQTEMCAPSSIWTILHFHLSLVCEFHLSKTTYFEFNEQLDILFHSELNEFGKKKKKKKKTEKKFLV